MSQEAGRQVLPAGAFLLGLPALRIPLLYGYSGTVTYGGISSVMWLCWHGVRSTDPGRAGWGGLSGHGDSLECGRIRIGSVAADVAFAGLTSAECISSTSTIPICPIWRLPGDRAVAGVRTQNEYGERSRRRLAWHYDPGYPRYVIRRPARS